MKVSMWQVSLVRKINNKRKIRKFLVINRERKIKWQVKSQQKYDSPILAFDVYCFMI